MLRISSSVTRSLRTGHRSDRRFVFSPVESLESSLSLLVSSEDLEVRQAGVEVRERRRNTNNIRGNRRL